MADGDAKDKRGRMKGKNIHGRQRTVNGQISNEKIVGGTPQTHKHLTTRGETKFTVNKMSLIKGARVNAAYAERLWNIAQRARDVDDQKQIASRTA